MCTQIFYAAIERASEKNVTLPFVLFSHATPISQCCIHSPRMFYYHELNFKQKASHLGKFSLDREDETFYVTLIGFWP